MVAVMASAVREKRMVRDMVVDFEKGNYRRLRNCE